MRAAASPEVARSSGVRGAVKQGERGERGEIEQGEERGVERGDL